MFKIITLKDTIRIPPEAFGEPIQTVGREQLRMKYEGMVDSELGYVVAVTDIEVNPVGKIVPGDGATYHRVAFSLLTFYPEVQEVVEGEVVELTSAPSYELDLSTLCFTFPSSWMITSLTMKSKEYLWAKRRGDDS